MGEITNTGTDPIMWIGIIRVVAVVLCYAISISWIYKNRSRITSWPGQTPAKVQTAILVAVCTLITIALFHAYGSGEQPELVDPEDYGNMQRIERMSKEQPIESVRAKTLEKRPAELKAQERDYEKEQEEADKYVEQALKGAKR